MNGPQRTACLAKGCINNQYQLTMLRQWAAQWLHPLPSQTGDVGQDTHGRKDRQ